MTGCRYSLPCPWMPSNSSYPGGGTAAQQSISLINALLVWIMTRIEGHQYEGNVLPSGEAWSGSVLN
jgi:hypothetical protein